MISPNKLLKNFLSNRLGKSAKKLELYPRLNILEGNVSELTEIEKQSIDQMWGKIGAGIVEYDFWKFYKSYLKSDNLHTIVPDNIFWSRIVRTLNPISMTRTYTNKSLYPIIFNGLRQPAVIANVIDGVVYDNDMKVLSLERAIDKLASSDSDIIVKPTKASSGGAGVRRLSCGSSPIDIRKILSEMGRNYICQQAVRQSESTAIFNESSLNTFRVNTINLNGNVSCECLMMRHGLNGSVVDNFARGGIACGMNNRGDYNGYNVNIMLQRVSKLQDGTDYDTITVPEVKKVISVAIGAHRRYMPHIGHAAWDFAIDESNNPVMIEVNLMLPGIMIEQLTSGHSIFGNRTEEVIHHATKQFGSLSWTEYVGGW